MYLYLDDERPTPPGYTRAYTAQEAIDFIKTNTVIAVSLDHDLGTEEDGYDVALFIEKGAAEGWLKPMVCMCHSANPAGRSRINAALNSAYRYWGKNPNDWYDT